MTAAVRTNWKLEIGVPAIIFLACFLITLTPKFGEQTAILSNAIVVDLLVTAPLAYLLIIRKTRLSRWPVLHVFVAGIFFAGLILNTRQSGFILFIRTWISPLIEGSLIFMVVRKFYLANKNAKQTGLDNIDFLFYCRKIMREVIGNEKAGNLISSEVSVFYYAFSLKKGSTIDNQNVFSTYKKNGIILVLATFLCLFIIEMAGLHFLLTLWNSTVAWVFTALSLYTCLQLFAHIRAIKARPIVINDDSIDIHNGLAGDAHIRFDNIEKIELTKKNPVNCLPLKIALISGMEGHNVVIYLKRHIVATKIFGIKKSTAVVLFYVDQPHAFAESLKSNWTGAALTGAAM